MSPEYGFLLGYAGLLLLAAMGLDRLGRIDPSPWRGRVLAAHRRRHPESVAAPATESGDAVQWPQREQRRLHTGIAAVAATAAAAILVIVLARHHRGWEIVAPLAMLAASLAELALLGRRLPVAS